MKTYEQNPECKKVLDAIDQAKDILTQLQDFALATSRGDLPDMADVVKKTHELRQNADSILVGLIEARSFKSDSE